MQVRTCRKQHSASTGATRRSGEKSSKREEGVRTLQMKNEEAWNLKSILTNMRGWSAVEQGKKGGRGWGRVG